MIKRRLRAPFLFVRTALPIWTDGVYAKPGDNGRTRFQHFCEGCGSPLFHSGEGRPDNWGIGWRSTRQRDQLKPARQIWRRSAAPWINDIRDLPGRPGG
jgi:hypothetical protein